MRTCELERAAHYLAVDALERRAQQRPAVQRQHAREHGLLAVRSVDGRAVERLAPPDLDNEPRARVQQLNELRVDRIDGASQLGQRTRVRCVRWRVAGSGCRSGRRCGEVRHREAGKILRRRFHTPMYTPRE
jgi:hypothetical protein